jgi:glucosamine-6-phosphate deaminase
MRDMILGRAGREVLATVYPDAEALGEALAREILDRIGQARAAGRRFLLGCPGGRSLRSTYRALGRLCRREQADLSGVMIVMMDDYLVQGPRGLVHCPAEAHYSCRRFAWVEIRLVLNEGLSPSRQVTAENVWFPDPSEPAAYDARIRAAGGIDLFLIASGASDGHVAFNPPGSERRSTTRIIPLPQSTRKDNLATFPEFNDLSEVPGHGLSVGLGTIADLSRSVWLVMHGREKRQSLRMLATHSDFTPDWPVSIIFRCQDARIILDEEVAKELETK